MSANVQVVETSILGRTSLEATVRRACRHCGAPAVFCTHESIRDGWPECWVPEGDLRSQQPVGPVCPCCGVPRHRSDDQHLGEVWAREIRAPDSCRLCNRVRDFLSGLRGYFRRLV